MSKKINYYKWEREYQKKYQKKYREWRQEYYRLKMKKMRMKKILQKVNRGFLILDEKSV